MPTEVLIALIGLLGSAIGSLIGIVASSKLTAYRLEQLEKKMDGNAELTKRVVVLETKVEALENDGK